MSDKYIVRSNRLPLDVLNISMSEFVWNNLQNLNPDNICIIDSTTDTKLTVKELITKSNALAMALVAKGVQKSDTIMTFAANSIEHMITLFAGAFLGTTLYPISPNANLYEMESLLETLGSMAIFTSAAKADIIDQVLAKNKKIKTKTVVVFDGVYNEFTTFADMLSKGNNQMLPKIPYFDVDPNKDIFIMLLSSGTTGAPKSLMTSHVAFNILG
ncbi:unnamed protein product [Medioppia subpectinata]|uniref:AMP-dependent synthetase/ligase domain-containing protein n=1 Tax=Medioppia subpectinata TaxID=1979941 RepID=A0A7R9LX15_9ACAR|nr:unnamed protein product [Medioppia subpectinata]CAG2121860.1 unnamed protein product [Medioppia subpectinata]